MSSAALKLPQPSATPAGRALQAAVWSSRIEGLDFLRAFAVLSVLYAHSVEVRVWWIPEGLASFGVKLFFVLSGFLITRLLMDEATRSGRIHLGAFYQRRFARLMPAFYLFLAMALAIMWVTHKPIPWAGIGSAVLYVTNYYQAFTGAQPIAVAHCWSLAVEEQFYVLWPLLLMVAVRRKWSLPTLLIALTLAVWCWRWWLLWSGWLPEEYLYRALDTRADDLLVGCLVAVWMRDPAISARIGAWLEWRPLPWLLIGAIIFSLSIQHMASWKFGLCFVIEPPLIALLMLACIRSAHEGKSVPARLLFNQTLFVHIGKVSYGVYLFHALFLYAIETRISRMTGQPLLGFVAGMTVTIIVASLSFRWVESPLRDRINRL